MRGLQIVSAVRRNLIHNKTRVRQFSSSTPRDASWGFIGLGAMGEYPHTESEHSTNRNYRLPHGEESTSEDSRGRQHDGV